MFAAVFEFFFGMARGNFKDQYHIDKQISNYLINFIEIDFSLLYNRHIVEENKSNIGKGTWMVLIGTALFFDTLEALISLIPIAGEILAMFIDGFAFATFWLVFKMNGETYSKKTMIAGAVIGFIPIVNMLPECTLTIVKLYFDSKAKKVLAKIPGGNSAGNTIGGNKQKPQLISGNKQNSLPNETGRGRVPLQSPRFNLARSPEQKELLKTENAPRISNLLDLRNTTLNESKNIYTLKIPHAVDEYKPDQQREEKLVNIEGLPEKQSVVEKVEQQTELKDLQKEAIPVPEVQVTESVVKSLPISEGSLEDNKVVYEKIKQFEPTETPETSVITEKTIPVEATETKEGLERHVPEDMTQSHGDVINNTEGFDHKPDVRAEPKTPLQEIATHVTEAPIAQKFDTILSPEEDMSTYLENNVYKNFGVSSKNQDSALAEAPEDKREALQRSFQNIRDSLADMYELETVDGRVDEQAYQLAREANEQATVSRQDFRKTISREQLTEMLNSEFERSQSTGFISVNTSMGSIRKVIDSGEFKDVFGLSASEKKKMFRSLSPRYYNKRKAVEEALGVRRDGNEVVLYGAYAHDFNNENMYGGAKQYGDIFIKFKADTETSYTEGDSMEAQGINFVTGKTNKTIKSKGSGFKGNRALEDEYENVENPRSRQISADHAPLAKALIAVDLKRQAEAKNQSHVGPALNGYLEAQIRNPKFENIESINIPRSALTNASEEDTSFLDELRNNPVWRDKINIIE
ncbi:MAG: hypothetical protein WCK48_01365 [bacterium]